MRFEKKLDSFTLETSNNHLIRNLLRYGRVRVKNDQVVNTIKIVATMAETFPVFVRTAFRSTYFCQLESMRTKGLKYYHKNIYPENLLYRKAG